LFIRIAENLIAVPKHRKLRRKMELSKSYPEWYKYAAELDQSQKRDRWLKLVDDQTSKRYNWDFIRELMKDMQRARVAEDPIFMLAVLQQCTRKVRRFGGTTSKSSRGLIFVAVVISCRMSAVL
jgi:Domain of unknown function (DUF3336)